MRILLGMILGILLTIGFAYVHDSASIGETTSQTRTEQKPIVNWDVAMKTWTGFSSSVRNSWNRLAAS
jgi:hypothetical protein